MLLRIGSGFASQFLFMLNRTFALIIFGVPHPHHIAVPVLYNAIITAFIGYAFSFTKIYNSFILGKKELKFSFILPFKHEVLQAVKLLYTYFIVFIMLFENTVMALYWQQYLTSHAAKAVKLRENHHVITSTLFENAVAFHSGIFVLALVLKVCMTFVINNRIN